MTRKGSQRRGAKGNSKTSASGGSTHHNSSKDKRISVTPDEISTTFPIFRAQNRANKEDSNSGSESRDQREIRTLRWLCVYTITTVLIFGVSFYQSKISRDQLDLSRETEIVSSRSFVISNSFRFISYQDVSVTNREWHFYPIIENVGNTPTRNLHVYQDGGICAHGPPDEAVVSDFFANYKRSTPSALSIGPKSDAIAVFYGFSNVVINCPVTLEAYGVITYDDIFGYHHITKFCYWYGSVADLKDIPANQPVRLYAETCGTPSCADDECENTTSPRVSGKLPGKQISAP